MTDPASERTHALYRFYGSDGSLLYIGITLDPGHRWSKHRVEKPWWEEIANITIELQPSRKAALEAERVAIIAEKPRYNIVHSRGSAEAPRGVPELDRVLPFQPGDWAALGLRDGRCPVGEIVAYDEEWVSIRLKDAFHGSLMNRVLAVRWSEIERIELAYPEDAEPATGMEKAMTGAIRIMDDEHLGEFQVGWMRVKLGDEKDPVDAARLEYRREVAALERR